MPQRLQIKIISLCVPLTDLHLHSEASPGLFDLGLHFLGNVLFSAHHFPHIPDSRTSVDTQRLSPAAPRQSGELPVIRFM